MTDFTPTHKLILTASRLANGEVSHQEPVIIDYPEKFQPELMALSGKRLAVSSDDMEPVDASRIKELTDNSPVIHRAVTVVGHKA